jgi:hypothetical protein
LFSTSLMREASFAADHSVRLNIGGATPRRCSYFDHRN